nr:hypothetical protein [Halorubrum salsamenti]
MTTTSSRLASSATSKSTEIPPTVSDGDSEPAQAFRELAERTMDQVGRKRRRSHADGTAEIDLNQ